MLNRFFDTDEVIGDDVVYIRADGTGVPTGWNTDGWKNGDGVGADPEPTGAALDEIGSQPMFATAKIVALLAAAADVSVLE